MPPLLQRRPDRGLEARATLGAWQWLVTRHVGPAVEMLSGLTPLLKELGDRLERERVTTQEAYIAELSERLGRQDACIAERSARRGGETPPPLSGKRSAPTRSALSDTTAGGLPAGCPPPR